MIWRNPFFNKNSENQSDAAEFLALFDSSVLKMINEQHLNGISYISSTPGAGKTTLFRAFSPDILNSARRSEDRDEMADMKRELARLGIIRDGEVTLLSGMLSCATGYSILDEMFQNGKRKQVFFALLNYRIAIILIRTIASILDMEKNEYHRISFSFIPTEMLSEAECYEDGAAVYDWACREERRLCKLLDHPEDAELELPLMNISLIIVKLFEPANILIDGKQVFHNVLIIFDDFHKLSAEQRQGLSENLYLLKSNVGIWFGQRLEGLDNKQIISQDGSLDRNYNENIVIENYWNQKREAFYKMLGNIADRRVNRVNIANEAGLIDYLDTKITDSVIERKLSGFIDARRAAVLSDANLSRKYSEVMEREYKTLKDEAIVYECIQIREKRLQDGQLRFDLGEVLDADVFLREFVEANRNGAWYYICMQLEIPFYYTYDNIKVLSSYNVEQFLGYAGDYYDGCRAKVIGQNSRSGKRKKLTAVEQEAIIFRRTERLWDDMDSRYSNITDIKKFLNEIARVCQQSRDAEKNSYEGGAYTGIGIKNEELKKLVSGETESYKKLTKILGQCLASRYFERREIKNDITVFYLNRWLCVHYQLPLAYGGWKHWRLRDLLNVVSGGNIESFEQYYDGFIWV